MLFIYGFIVEVEDGMEGDFNFEKFSGRFWFFLLVSWEVVLVYLVVEVVICVRDYIWGFRLFLLFILEVFKVREVLMLLRLELLLFEYGDLSCLWFMIGGFNFVLDIEGVCILFIILIGVRVFIRLFLLLKIEFFFNIEFWLFLIFKMFVNRNFKKINSFI